MEEVTLIYTILNLLNIKLADASQLAKSCKNIPLFRLVPVVNVSTVVEYFINRTVFNRFKAPSYNRIASEALNTAIECTVTHIACSTVAFEQHAANMQREKISGNKIGVRNQRHAVQDSKPTPMNPTCLVLLDRNSMCLFLSNQTQDDFSSALGNNYHQRITRASHGAGGLGFY